MVNCNKSNLYRLAINIFFMLLKLGRVLCMASVLSRTHINSVAPVPKTINKINIAA